MCITRTSKRFRARRHFWLISLCSSVCFAPWACVSSTGTSSVSNHGLFDSTSLPFSSDPCRTNNCRSNGFSSANKVTAEKGELNANASASATEADEFGPHPSRDSLHIQSLNNSTKVTNSRNLEQRNKNPPPLWQPIYVTFVLLIMCALLLSNKIGADWTMVICLTLCMASQIITTNEALIGFSNEGLITATVLLIIPAGIAHTGALDWYMTILLGKPRNIADAQVRIFIPLTILSAFLNNAPVVVVMIPVVQRWAKNIGIHVSQLMLPMNFAVILGGTCTFIGSSTNLVVSGLLGEQDPKATQGVSIFSLGLYGVPLALVGEAYMILFSQFLLPGGTGTDTASQDAMAADDRILLGARLTRWSFAAGRTVKRSGLRDTGGIYLVSVYRAATGNIHRAVGQDFLLESGDVLYFTAFAEEFAQFCEEHGLEILTSEVEQQMLEPDQRSLDSEVSGISAISGISTPSVRYGTSAGRLRHTPRTIGCTRESLTHADTATRMRCIYRMLDLIHGISPSTPYVDEADQLSDNDRLFKTSLLSGDVDPPQIVVHVERDSIIIAVNCRDRPGVLQDISACIAKLNLQCRRTEAAVFGLRSFSIWRCQVLNDAAMDAEEIWDAVKDLLVESEIEMQSIRQSALRVVRAIVTKHSRLVGKTAADVNFRVTYRAAIVAIKRRGRNVAGRLAKTCFEVGDLLVLQATNESHLLVHPEPDFYKRLDEGSTADGITSGHSPIGGALARMKDTFRQSNSPSRGSFENRDIDEVHVNSRGVHVRGEVRHLEDSRGYREAKEAVWRDLQVLFIEEDEKKTTPRDYLTAMTVPSSSYLSKKSALEAGLTSLPGLVLVSIERPLLDADLKVVRASDSIFASCFVKTGNATDLRVDSIPFDETLAVGDILWFAGTASSIGDLRKIPGLVSYESDEVHKIKERVHDRRLVQAVIAKKSVLVGKTPTDVSFRTRYGAAVIAINREGTRLYEHPGKVKLRAGDVLLLEAGPTFIKKNTGNGNSFTLLSEVENSAPPRLRMLIPALVITIAMIAIAAAGVTSLVISAIFASALMVFCGILSLQEARDAVNWGVYTTVASAIGIGIAMENSGISEAVAGFFVRIGDSLGIGSAGVLGSVYLMTALLCYLVTSKAAVALIFPVASAAAYQSGTDIVLMSYSVIFAAASCYMSPFAYTTNSLIFGLGGYKRADYIRFGAPLQLILWIVTTVLLSIDVSWYWSWVATGGLFIVVASVSVIVGCSLFMAVLTRCRSSEQPA